MYLRALEINNFRSLEEVKLTGLGQFNVLIGRNNSGKSAALAAVAMLADAVVGRPPDWPKLVSRQEPARQVHIKLTASLNEHDRAEFTQLVAPQRSQHLLQSLFARETAFTFESKPGQQFPIATEVAVIGEDGNWGNLSVQANEAGQSKRFQLSRLPAEASLDGAFLTEQANNANELSIIGANSLSGQYYGDAAAVWPHIRLTQYLRESFFFQPYRHAAARQGVGQTTELAQDGSNLARRLDHILGEDWDKFQAIRHFVEAAVPGVGFLQTPFVNASEIEVGFRSEYGNYISSLTDMGGGIEQLLMVATVLLTTPSDHSLFLEEPEVHLHPGAQRFLIERLLGGERQVFITTHSPTFVNVSGERSLYQVSMNSGRSDIRLIAEATDLGVVLEDIGLRNSDVLLSDAVVFVESDYDARSLSAWAEKLDRDLAERNITPRQMGGGSSSHAKVGSSVLLAISQRASAIPHIYVLDRDERSAKEIDDISKTLGERVWFLARRELENYFLIPTLLRRYLSGKQGVDKDKLDATSDSELMRLIERSADQQRGRVLVKRLRSAVGGIRDKDIRRHIEALVPEAACDDLARLIEERAASEYEKLFDHDHLKQLVQVERTKLDEEWSDETRLALAPGEEVLKEVLRTFGSTYSKSDAPRLANQMSASEIPDEIRQLVERIWNLAPRT